MEFKLLPACVGLAGLLAVLVDIALCWRSGGLQAQSKAWLRRIEERANAGELTLMLLPACASKKCEQVVASAIILLVTAVASAWFITAGAGIGDVVRYIAALAWAAGALLLIWKPPRWVMEWLHRNWTYCYAWLLCYIRYPACRVAVWLIISLIGLIAIWMTVTTEVFPPA